MCHPAVAIGEFADGVEFVIAGVDEGGFWDGDGLFGWSGDGAADTAGHGLHGIILFTI